MSDFDQYLDDAMKSIQREDRARREQDESDRRRLRQAEARVARAEQVAQKLCLAAANRLEQAAVPRRPVVETHSRDLRFATMLANLTYTQPKYRSTTYRKTGEVWGVGELYLDREGILRPGWPVRDWEGIRGQRGFAEPKGTSPGAWRPSRSVKESVQFDPPTLRGETGAVFVSAPIRGEEASRLPDDGPDWRRHLYELGDDDAVQLVTVSHTRDGIGNSVHAEDLAPWLARAVAALIATRS